MYKVMLVDDDTLMLKYLENLLDWKETNTEIVASTFSSVKALTLFDNYQPDLVITDIGIPQMDGLELAAQLKEKNPEVRIILLTCHEDFYYAKKAIQIDVDDYLIKDELNKDQLISSITKALANLEQTTSVQEALHYQTTIEDNKMLLKQSFSEKLSEHGLRKDVEDFGRSLGVNWRYDHFHIAVSASDYSIYMPEQLEAKFSELHHQAFLLAEELASESSNFTILLDNRLNLVVIYNFKKRFTHNSSNVFKQFLNNIHKHVKDNLQLELNFFLQEITERNGLGPAIKELDQLKLAYFYQTNLEIYHDASPIEVTFNRIKDSLLDPYIKDVIQSIQHENSDEMQGAFLKIEEISRKLLIDPAQLRQKLQMLYSFFHSNDQASRDFMTCLENTVTMDQLLYLLEQKIQSNMKDKIKKAANKQRLQNPKLKEIDLYIAEHLSENITSITVANYLHLNSSYFSRYFKQLTGVNFTDYIHQYKIKVAIKMLVEDNETIEFIAYRLGYSDRSYFSKIFKKYTGMSPSKYKRTHEANQQSLQVRDA